MAKFNGGTAAVLECVDCGGEGHGVELIGDAEGEAVSCGGCNGTGVARCDFCTEADAVVLASWRGEAARPSCGPCAAVCDAEARAA